MELMNLCVIQRYNYIQAWYAYPCLKPPSSVNHKLNLKNQSEGRDNVEIDLVDKNSSGSSDYKSNVEVDVAYVCTSSASIGAYSVDENKTQTNSIKKQTAHTRRSKSKKYKKQQNQPSFELKIFNRFGAFKDDANCEIYSTNIIEDTDEEHTVELKSLRLLSNSRLSLQTRS